MKSVNRAVIGVAAVIFLVSVGSAAPPPGFETSFVTERRYMTSGINNPSISGDIVIWDEYVINDGFWGDDLPEEGGYIYGLDLATWQQLDIPSGNHAYESDVSGDVVVWCDYRNSDRDIYGYNMATGEQLSICTVAGDQRYPSISGGTIVWYDERNGGRAIYGYDLSTSQEFMLPATCDPVRGSVRIDGDIVVWTDWRNGNRDIYAYDLSTGQEFAVCLDPSPQHIPAVSGDVIAWADSRNERTDIIGYDISTGAEFVVCRAPKSQWRPVVGDRFIAWEDNRRGYSDLMAYDLETGREYVVDDEKNTAPFTCDLDGDTLLWMDLFMPESMVWITRLPEPTTMAVLALGGLLVLKRRRC